MVLWDRWCELWGRLQAEGDPKVRYTDLAGLYTQPHRAYHTLKHVDACLTAFDAARHLCSHPNEVDYAIWFHDAIYDPRRLDNEAQSARLAQEVADAIKMSSGFGSRVADLILATKHESLPTNPDAQWVVDVDLSGLGLSFEEFSRNGDLVRQEYDWLEETEFKKNQEALFRRFLGRPSVFCTEFFQSKHEQQARSNLERALAMS